jgi:ATP-dependent protease HslVU (ClpYQ) peptidase subunit
MTCIAAAIDQDGAIFMGSDAVASRDSAIRLGSRSKIFERDGFLMGSSGTLRLGQILEFLFEPPAVETNLDGYIVRFSNALRESVREHGGECETDAKTTEANGSFIVGIRGRLFCIDGGYGAFSPLAPYCAIGCADQEALAAMFTVVSLFPDSYSAEQVVRRGLEAAAELDVNIRPPFTILKLEAQ